MSSPIGSKDQESTTIEEQKHQHDVSGRGGRGGRYPRRDGADRASAKMQQHGAIPQQRQRTDREERPLRGGMSGGNQPRAGINFRAQDSSRGDRKRGDHESKQGDHELTERRKGARGDEPSNVIYVSENTRRNRLVSYVKFLFHSGKFEDVELFATSDEGMAMIPRFAATMVRFGYASLGRIKTSQHHFRGEWSFKLVAILNKSANFDEVSREYGEMIAKAKSVS